MVRPPFWWREWRGDARRGDALPMWQYLPGVRTWDDPTWEWAIHVPLPFGLLLRIGKGDRSS